MSEPTTEARRRLLAHLAYVRDPAHYEPGDFYAEDKPLVATVEAEAANAALAALREEVEKLPTRHPHGVMATYQHIDKPAVLALIKQHMEPKP